MSIVHQRETEHLCDNSARRGCMAHSIRWFWVLFRLEFNPPCRTKMVSLHLNDLEAAVLHNLANIFVPPASVLISMLRSSSV